jgi:hypothetical protein
VNSWDTIESAIREARQIDNAAAAHAKVMAGLIVGKLRRCNASDLAALKRELAKFDCRSNSWKS